MQQDRDALPHGDLTNFLHQPGAQRHQVWVDLIRPQAELVKRRQCGRDPQWVPVEGTGVHDPRGSDRFEYLPPPADAADRKSVGHGLAEHCQIGHDI